MESTTAIIQGCIGEIMRRLDCEARANESAAPASASTAVLDEGRTILDEEARAIGYIKARMEERLKEIGRRRNILAPIHRLPNEVLGIIFESVERGASPIFFRNLLSVSHKWRTIALDTPSLWTNLRNLPTPILDVFIARSKQCPLEVSYGRSRVPGDLSKLLQYVAHVSPYAHRWKTCKLLGPQRARAEILSRLISPVPNMETLTISLYDMDSAAELDEATDPFDTIFAGSTPRLRELVLDGAFVPLSSPIYSGLTKLELGRIQYSSSDSVRLLLHAFESCPLLEKLALSDIYVDFDNDVGPAPSSIKLPKLQLFQICQNFSMDWLQYYILGCVVIPPSSTLQLSIATYVPTGFSMDLLSEPLPRINNPYHGLQNISAVKQLSIQLEDDERVCHTDGYVSDAGKRSFSFHMCTDVDPFSHTLSTLHPAFPMPLESLTLSFPSHLKSPHPVNITSLADFLRQHALIRKLKFASFWTPAIQVLKVTPTQHLCPRLEELHVIDCTVDIRELTNLVRPRVKAGVEESAFAGDIVCLARLRIDGCSNASQLTSSEVPEYLDVILEGELVSKSKGV
ncbi:hypothetical protein BOTBODRAFT_611601 [Botryobasidium botryosum FD-172 SS1]|uniref:Uncharacterized protein n=1 Tax=Botryobasidium botryosum (strain FD-172 SS1) TaxID=930990 RepID=A0A067LVL4_BOTB1|nr:hypothetical protein BOTBODRAFT_611601 [Botryobasidium botryosum FD-172 SS1]